MSFICAFWRMPNDQELCLGLEAAATRLYEKLGGLDTTFLDISDYNKKRLGHHLQNLQSDLQTYVFILAWALHNIGKPLRDCVVLNYGGGIGLLAMLAKEAGVRIVAYNDNYDVSCRDAEVIAKRIGNISDYYIHGEIDELSMYLRGEKISCDAIVSYGVIEHIYDVKTFLSRLTELSAENLTVVLGSGANPWNPLVRRRLMKTQRMLENVDRKKEVGHRERDCLEAYLKVRIKMISKMTPQLSVDIIDQLARLTRGLKESDIRPQVDRYVEAGQFPQGPDHPTNTCNPYTGDRANNLVHPGAFKSLLSRAGFSTHVMPGYYGGSQFGMKRLIGIPLNAAIRIGGRCALQLAPFFVLVGRKNS